MRLKELWDRYHFDDVNFQDETFFTQRERVRVLAERIIESGMKTTWAATMRADQGIRLPDDVWVLCKQSGLRRLLVGVESGSNEVLKRIRKDIKIEQVYEVAAKMVHHGIAGHFPFIVGFPEESDASIQATLDCAKRLRSMSPDFLTPIYYFKPYPGQRTGHRSRRARLRLPETLEAWAKFDYVAGEPGPLGLAREVRAHRAIQVLPRARLEAGRPRQAFFCSNLPATAVAATTIAFLLRCCSPAGWSRCRNCHDGAKAHPADQPADYVAAPRAFSAFVADTRRSTRAGECLQAPGRQR